MGAVKYAVGDHVKVTIEGDVNRVLGFDNGQELRIEVEGTDDFHYVYTDSANIEKVEPEYEATPTFGPGSLVRNKRVPSCLYVVGDGGFFSFQLNEWIDDYEETFPLDRYERVELP